MDEAILKEAWRLRKIGIYSMREIATKLGVNRERLIDELEAYLLAQSNTGSGRQGAASKKSQAERKG